ncbi:MAG: NADH-quinone oxidoreductase subunit C, partial [Muribaculaceae bacterium]|nr:NADH-quinone oxidoreductase subunit C [Muribaculaceae bacterium]
MANIQEKIAKLCQEATFEEGQDLLVCVPDSKWHALAKSLKEELHFDFLVTIVGMDWTDKLGCIYYLKSTADNAMISVKVTTEDRENPMIHSVHDVWAIATTFEREVYDFFGIIFVNNPDMRRMFLSIDWKGYPLRKDYDDSPEINPVPKENERQEDTTVSYVETEDGKIEKKTINVFEPNDFVVNIGPQHPATHGVLRFRTAVDGETIKKIDFYSGYIHRGIEKICEGLTYPQTLHFMDRMDYFSGHHYHHAMCMVYEKALGIEISRRAQVIRVLMDELARI